MNKITNTNYRNFLDNGIINTISEDQVKQALNNISGRRFREGRSLLIALYYTGARPNEVLRIKAKDVEKEGSYITVRVPASKGGLPRKIYLRWKIDLVKELYKFASARPLEMYLFYNYWSKYKRKVVKKGVVTKRRDISAKLYYNVVKWFTGVVDDSVSPYFLRHNRFSKLSEAGLTMEELRMIKGSRSIDSVGYYVHMSTGTAKKAAKKIE